MTIKAVFFDAAGTLIKTVKPVGESYAFFAKQYGKDISLPALTERFRSCFASAPPLAFPQAKFDAIETLERDWWKRLVQRIFEPWGRFEGFDQFFNDLFDHFGRPEAWTLYPEALAVLFDLKERGLTLDVISNFDSRLFTILEGLGAARFFDAIVISSRTGHAKPAAQIFHSALERHRLHAPEAMHVGDSPKHDAAGAIDAGLLAVLVDRQSKIESGSFLKVQTLKELPPLVDRLTREWP